MTIIELLELYIKDQLPKDIRLVHLTIEKTAYGDIQIIDPNPYRSPGRAGTPTAAYKEHLSLEQYYILDRAAVVHAAYSETLKTLVVGKWATNEDRRTVEVQFVRVEG